MVKIGINGFGRIGRAILRIALARGLNVVAINDLHGAQSAAYTLKFDSVYGRHDKPVEARGDVLLVDGKKIHVLEERDPQRLPWRSLGVDIVIESTGLFTHAEDARAHIKAGAKKVIITAPAKNQDVTIVPGVNSHALKPTHSIISVGSCTTNCTAPVLKVLLDALEISSAMLTTIHAYTNDQVILDNAHHNVRRGRAAGLNMIPTTTGAAEAVIEVLPQLKGCMTGLSVRVPVACGSLIDLTCELKKKTSEKEVRKILEKAARTSMRGIMEYTEDQLVSSDIIANPHSVVIDASSIQLTGNLLKILAWYDNEFGYSNRVVDVIEMMRK